MVVGEELPLGRRPSGIAETLFEQPDIFLGDGVCAPHQIDLQYHLQHGGVVAACGETGVEGDILCRRHIAHREEDTGELHIRGFVFGYEDKGIRPVLRIAKQMFGKHTLLGQRKVQVVQGRAGMEVCRGDFDKFAPLFVDSKVFIAVAVVEIWIADLPILVTEKEQGRYEKNKAGHRQKEAMTVAYRSEYPCCQQAKRQHKPRKIMYKRHALAHFIVTKRRINIHIGTNHSFAYSDIANE